MATSGGKRTPHLNTGKKPPTRPITPPSPDVVEVAGQGRYKLVVPVPDGDGHKNSSWFGEWWYAHSVTGAAVPVVVKRFTLSTASRDESTYSLVDQSTLECWNYEQEMSRYLQGLTPVAGVRWQQLVAAWEDVQSVTVDGGARKEVRCLYVATKRETGMRPLSDIAEPGNPVTDLVTITQFVESFKNMYLAAWGDPNVAPNAARRVHLDDAKPGNILYEIVNDGTSLRVDLCRIDLEGCQFAGQPRVSGVATPGWTTESRTLRAAGGHPDRELTFVDDVHYAAANLFWILTGYDLSNPSRQIPSRDPYATNPVVGAAFGMFIEQTLKEAHGTHEIGLSEFFDEVSRRLPRPHESVPEAARRIADRPLSPSWGTTEAMATAAWAVEVSPPSSEPLMCAFRIAVDTAIQVQDDRSHGYLATAANYLCLTAASWSLPPATPNDIRLVRTVAETVPSILADDRFADERTKTLQKLVDAYPTVQFGDRSPSPKKYGTQSWWATWRNLSSLSSQGPTGTIAFVVLRNLDFRAGVYNTHETDGHFARAQTVTQLHLVDGEIRRVSHPERAKSDVVIITNSAGLYTWATSSLSGAETPKLYGRVLDARSATDVAFADSEHWPDLLRAATDARPSPATVSLFTTRIPRRTRQEMKPYRYYVYTPPEKGHKEPAELAPTEELPVTEPAADSKLKALLDRAQTRFATAVTTETERVESPPKPERHPIEAVNRRLRSVGSTTTTWLSPKVSAAGEYTTRAARRTPMAIMVISGAVIVVLVVALARGVLGRQPHQVHDIGGLNTTAFAVFTLSLIVLCLLTFATNRRPAGVMKGIPWVALVLLVTLAYTSGNLTDVNTNNSVFNTAVHSLRTAGGLVLPPALQPEYQSDGATEVLYSHQPEDRSSVRVLWGTGGSRDADSHARWAALDRIEGNGLVKMHVGRFTAEPVAHGGGLWVTTELEIRNLGANPVPLSKDNVFLAYENVETAPMPPRPDVPAGVPLIAANVPSGTTAANPIALPAAGNATWFDQGAMNHLAPAASTGGLLDPNDRVTFPVSVADPTKGVRILGIAYLNGGIVQGFTATNHWGERQTSTDDWALPGVPVGFNQLKEYDCFRTAAYATPSLNVGQVDCGVTHDFEVTAVVPIPDETDPHAASYTAAATAECSRHRNATPFPFPTGQFFSPGHLNAVCVISAT